MWRFGGIVQDSGRHYKIWKACGSDVSPVVTGEGVAAPGWVDVGNSRWGVQIAVPDMAKSAPKAIVVNGYVGLAQIYFYPPHAMPLRLASGADPDAPTLADRLGCKVGQPWTNRVSLKFHTGPHPLGFRRELSDAAFRKVLEAMGKRDIRCLGIATGSLDGWVQDVLNSDITVRHFFARLNGYGGFGARWQVQPICKKLDITYHPDWEQVVEEILKRFGAE